jgi:hypothetical protein
MLRHDVGMKTLWTLLPFFRGLAGHEHDALKDLVTFFDQMFRRDRDVLLVTGDLTSTGKNSQFKTAVQFICNELPLSPGVGLNTDPWLDQAMRGNRDGIRHQVIPGNHDHWPGRYWWILGPPRSRMCAWANTLPFMQTATMEVPGTPVQLRFLAVNTDADVGDWTPERVLARGRFHTQLSLLEAALEPLPRVAPNEVRILLLHHSLAYRAKYSAEMQSRFHQAVPKGELDPQEDEPAPQAAAAPDEKRTWLRRVLGWGRRAALKELEINADSRRRLHRLLGDFDIPVILTGHTHVPDVRCHSTLSRERKRRVPFLEACCGSTTQLNEVPSKWNTRSRDRQLDPNTLLVHQLTVRHGEIFWRTETWRRSHLLGFKPFPEAQGERSEPWASELRVWPRP